MNDQALAGLVVVDKPAGMTSHDVVARLRRLAGTRKVGHAGTLDPMATGVLVVGLNRATRLLGHLTLTEKAYDATVRLGAAHHHRRRRGGALATASDRATSTRSGPRGRWPRSSATCSSGPRRSRRSRSTASGPTHRVRAGEDVDLPARPVTVHELRVGATCAGAATRSTSTSRCAAAAAPTCGRSPATWGTRWASAGTSRRCDAPRSGPFDLAEAHTLDALADHFAVLDRRRGPALLPARRPRRRAGPRRRLRSQARARPLDGAGPVAVFAPDGDVPGALRAARRARRPRGRLHLSGCGTFRGHRRRIAERSSPPCRSGARSTTCPADLGRTVVTVGNFDGVHLGHQHVVGRAREVAASWRRCRSWR